MKRFLNKIIFINSASVPYAEVFLDGNIHFVGSNGFGKTTVLRAILFFYHATSDKRTLSIREDQKSFSSYYFAEENSYLIYEVATDDSFFSVLVFKKGGKLHFKFIDSEYDKSNFLTNYSANSLDEILNKLNANKITHTEDVQRYADFRKVIYGESSNKLFRPYAIFQSSDGKQNRKVANIPQLISNIFRTSKLDSKHIKKSIVEAVFEDSIKPLDLLTIERQLNKFKIDIRDLEVYEKNEKQAAELVTLLEKVKSIESNLLKEAEELGASLVHFSDKVESLDAEQIITKEILTQEEEKFKNEEDNFTKKSDELKSALTLLNRDLEEITSLKSKYKALDVEGAKLKVSRKEQFEIELARLREELNENLSLSSDLESVFKTRELKIQAEKNIFTNKIEKNKHQIQLDFTQKNFSLKDEFEKRKADIIEVYTHQLVDFDKSINSILERLSQLDLEIRNVGFHKNYFERIENHRTKITKQEALIKNIEHELDKVKSEKEQIKAHYLLKQQNKEETYKLKISDSEKRIEDLKSQLQKLQEIKEGYSGSFLEFLEKEDTNLSKSLIQVFNSEILYNKKLNPKIVNQSETVFGINAEWKNAFTAKKYSSLEKLNKQIRNLEKDISRFEYLNNQLLVEFTQDKASLENEFTEQNAYLKSKNSELEFNLNQETSHLKKYILELESEESANAKVKKEAERNLIEHENAINEELSLAQGEKKKIILLKEKSLEELANELNDNIEKNENWYHASKYKIQSEEDEFYKKIERDLEELQQEKISLTKNNNSKNEKFEKERIKRVGELEFQLQEINNKLERLCEQFEYDVDRILRHEDVYLRRQKDLNENLLHSKQAFRSNNQEQKNRIEDLKEKLYQLHSDKMRFESMISEDYDAFRYSGTGIYDLLKERIENPSTSIKVSKDIKSIIQVLNSNYTHLQLLTTKLQKNIHRFTGLFSSNNFLNFPSSKSFDKEKDYQSFIKHKLEPFVTNNSIKQARVQIEKIHAELISDIAYDAKDFSLKTTEIEETILQLNKDFNKTNFVGVVKSIELEYRENTNPLIKVLNKLRKFAEKNNFHAQSDIFKTDRTQEMDKLSIKLLMELKTAIDQESKNQISVEDTFNLWFRIKENNNDTGWVEKLSNVGSEGTDVLVKAMIYITLLNVFKENTFVKKSDYFIHCMIDEVGKLSDRYLRELIDFTNSKNIRLIFGSPNENDPMIYRHVYKLHRENDKVKVIELVGEV